MPLLKFLPAQAGDVDITYADNTKARHLLGYAPRTSLQEGLRQFVIWLDATDGLVLAHSKSDVHQATHLSATS